MGGFHLKIFFKNRGRKPLECHRLLAKPAINIEFIPSFLSSDDRPPSNSNQPRLNDITCR